jgi:hypothetical protein
LELFPCNSKAELEKREGELIRSMECVNKRIEGRTKKEYYEEHKEHLQELMKQYQIKNYDKIKELTKQYRIENADKINEKKKENCNCECGGKYTKSHLARHQKTKKHIDFINQNI